MCSIFLNRYVYESWMFLPLRDLKAPPGSLFVPSSLGLTTVISLSVFYWCGDSFPTGILTLWADCLVILQFEKLISSIEVAVC